MSIPPGLAVQAARSRGISGSSSPSLATSASPAPTATGTTIVEDFEGAAVGIDQVKRLAFATVDLDLKQSLAWVDQQQPNPDMERHSRSAILSVGAILPLPPIGTTATGPLGTLDARSRINSTRTPVRACIAIKPVHSIQSLSTISTGEVSDKRGVVTYRDIEVRHDIRMRRRHDMHVGHFPFSGPRVRRKGDLPLLGRCNGGRCDGVVVERDLALTRTHCRVLFAILGRCDDHKLRGLPGSQRVDGSALARINQRC